MREVNTMNEMIESALGLYPCFKGNQGILFLRFLNISVMRIGELELPIRNFMYDPRTKAIFANEDEAAFDAIPTLIGLQEVLDDSLQADWSGRASRAIIFSWAIVAHALNGTLTVPVLRAWFKTAKSNWFNPSEALRRLRYEIFGLNESLEKRVN
jgi:hypothetical protein